MVQCFAPKRPTDASLWHSFTTFTEVSRRLSPLLRQVRCQTHFLSPEHTSEPGVGNVENRSGNRDAELLGGLRACAIGHGLGKRERSLRCGRATDGGPSIRSFDERKAGRQLSRRNRPGVGLHSTARKEVGEVRSSDGGFRRGGTGDHQGGGGSMVMLKACVATPVLSFTCTVKVVVWSVVGVPEMMVDWTP